MRKAAAAMIVKLHMLKAERVTLLFEKSPTGRVSTASDGDIPDHSSEERREANANARVRQQVRAARAHSAGGLKNAGLRPIADHRDVRRDTNRAHHLECSVRDVKRGARIQNALRLNVNSR